ncbi:MAG: NAD(P)/FAD-dependent oxidoreductase [Desulfofustis sp.]|nr:NAD(P)/FAD-dependent oxidoreductase [Desulfofustis sp.]
MGCVIIGAGAAGMQAALACRKNWPDSQVTVVDSEPEVGYYRTLIPQFINRALTEDRLFFWQQKQDRELDVRAGVSVDAVDRANRTLFLSDNQRLPYRRLIIASGGQPIVPPICRTPAVRGIFPVRNLTVARRARTWLRTNPDTVILGGGLVGVKLAAHLAEFNYPVTLIERERQLLPQALSAEAAGVVAAHLQDKGVRLFLAATVDDLQISGGLLEAVRVDARWIPCRTLFVAAGSLPDLDFLAGSGLVTEGRLEVTTSLQTGDSAIFAAGDVATIVDGDRFTPWTWPQAVVQGKLAAANLYAGAPLSLPRLTRVNAMNLNGLSLAILGLPACGYDRTVHADSGSTIYRELFHRDGRIVGGVLIGDISSAGRLHHMMTGGAVSLAEMEEYIIPRRKAMTAASLSLGKYRKKATWLGPGGG